MDDSLSEFQDKKKNIAVPKKLQPKKARKKPVKQIKGQKNIKSLFNRKNNELVKYSNEFEHVCKQSGVDVDSEQLQLAIALSKSLEEPKNSTGETIDEEKSLTSQARVLKIRKTLQEYGFKVPDTKVSVESNKRIKKPRNNYKLISLTDLEKQQIIADRYAEVLLNNLDVTVNTTAICVSYNTLYYKSTNISYEDIKNSNVFLVSNLLKKPVNKIDRLRNWSEIPGRPVSPVFEGPFISFKDIECSQDELDSILSSSLKTLREVLSKKLQINLEFNAQCSFNSNAGMSVSSDIHSDEIQKQYSNISTTAEHYNESNALPTTTNTFLSVTEQTRCISPDLFDDEVSIVMHTSHSSRKDETKNKTNSNSLSNHDVMDLTECVYVGGKFTNIETNSTVRKSNDHVEIRELLQLGSKESYEQIDLTQNKEYINDDTIEYCVEEKSICNAKSLPKTDVICVIEEVDISMHNDSKTCTINEVEDINTSSANFKIKEGISDAMDLTQSTNSSGGLPDIAISTKSNDISQNDTIIINENCYTSVKNDESNLNETQEVFDLTVDSGLQISNAEDIYVLSIGVDKTRNNEEIQVQTGYSDNINLTQSSNSSLGKSLECISNNEPESPKFEGIGKINNISVDYDIMFDNVMESYSNTTKSNHNSDEFNQTKNFTNNEASTSSYLSEPIEIFDNVPDTNYIEFGSISVLEDFSNGDKMQGVINENSLLPSVEIDAASNCDFHLEIVKDDTQDISPLKGDNNPNNDIIRTPSNKGYVIKTDEVTPMPNFDAMSTPEMNRELDKYGVKPFKRKRAIKLLTYIYNQTHPLVDSCVEDECSASKKLKTHSQNPDAEKAKSPIKSPRTDNPHESPLINDKENNIYKVTCDKPVIKEIECSPQDWLFQTREKAKISSCRVPLHIAFHNYVHSRRSLREAILCYEPINIDIIHKDLVASGYRYNPKDLLKFMDKKCITVKTADNDKRNKR